MSGFSTRVKLLEKWAPSLLPKLKDFDDLADIILDVWNEAEADTEARIIEGLKSRRKEVKHSLDKIGIFAQDYWQIKLRLLEIDYTIALIKGKAE